MAMKTDKIADHFLKEAVFSKVTNCPVTTGRLGAGDQARFDGGDTKGEVRE